MKTTRAPFQGLGLSLLVAAGAWTADASSPVFGARMHYSLATLAAVAFLFILNYWNLLGYHFG